MSNSLRTLEPKIPNAAAPTPTPAGPKAVSPFTLSCNFDRSRGEFVVRAGARAGGLVVAGLCLFAGAALAFLLGTAFRAGASGGGVPTEIAMAEEPVISAAPSQPTRQSQQSSKHKQAKQQPKRTQGSKQLRGSKPSATKVSKASEARATKAKPDAHGRQSGLNYLILKTCSKQSDATAARESLARKGVAATVERDLPGWAGKGWYTVVGTTGFHMDRDKTTLDRHVQELKSLKLNPRPYKWRGTEVASGE